MIFRIGNLVGVVKGVSRKVGSGNSTRRALPRIYGILSLGFYWYSYVHFDAYTMEVALSTVLLPTCCSG